LIAGGKCPTMGNTTDMLIVHVARARAAKTWETYVPPEEDEIA